MLLVEKQGVGDHGRMAPNIPPDAIKRQFAQRLRAVRERKYKSAAQFARRIGEEEETYRRWERGETEPGIADLNTILIELDVSADYLVTGLLPPPPKSR